jgi:hypothetical protein
MAKFEFMLQAFTKHQIVPLIEGERYEWLRVFNGQVVNFLQVFKNYNRAHQIK